MKLTTFSLLILLSSFLYSQERNRIIDFEVDTIGDLIFLPNEGAFIDNDYFLSEYGVSFHLDSLTSDLIPVISMVGEPATGFLRNNNKSFKYKNRVWTTRADIPEDSNDFGLFFLTDDGEMTRTKFNLYVDYNSDLGCSKASGYLLDIDGPERWIINIYKNGDKLTPVKTLTTCVFGTGYWPKSKCDIIETGDGIGTYWEFDISPGIIDYIEFIYDDKQSAYRSSGLAFDNFSFCSMESEKRLDIWGSLEVGEPNILENVEFEFDKSRLLASSFPELDKLVEFLKENPEILLEISGHTDNVGDGTYNRELSESRAKSVVDFLLSKGINKSRLLYVGYGDLKPIAKNDSEINRQKNRRVEFKIIE